MRRFFIVIGILSVGLTGCKKIMHEDEADLSDLSDKNSLELALNGMYYRFAMLFKTFYFGQGLKGDDMTEIYYGNRASSRHYELPVDSSGKLIFFDNPVILEGGIHFYTEEEKVNMLWDYSYNTILSVNNIIDKYSKGNISFELNPYVGEAFYMRAYCYYRLIRLFKNIPLVIDVDVNYNLPLVSSTDVFKQIESDLKEAIKLLPDNNSSARVPFATPHRGTAKALLAEVYLTMGGYPLNDKTKYPLAAKIAQEVIDSADYFGFGLLEDYAEIWHRENNANKESVFSVYYEANGIDIYHEYLELSFELTRPIISEINFYNNFPASYRKDVTYMNYLTGTAVQLGGIIFDSINGTFFFDTLAVLNFNHKYDTIGTADNIIFLKQHVYYWNTVELPLGQNGMYTVTNYDEKKNDQNISLYVFRYSHVLLTYAEAKARSGQTDAAAYEAINKVRRRANKVDIFSPSKYDLQAGLSVEQFADSVVNERAWEFAGEYEGRWFDLIRLEMVEKLPELRSTQEKGFPKIVPTKEDYYLTIPKSEERWF